MTVTTTRCGMDKDAYTEEEARLDALYLAEKMLTRPKERREEFMMGFALQTMRAYRLVERKLARIMGANGYKAWRKEVILEGRDEG